MKRPRRIAICESSTFDRVAEQDPGNPLDDPGSVAAQGGDGQVAHALRIGLPAGRPLRAI